MFLSQGYFSSRNCMREVMAVLKLKKPYLFVQEPDPSKGGAPLEVLCDELPREDYRKKLFDGRRITPWYRMMEFQLISLTQICEDFLQHTPKYKGHGVQPLYIPGSLPEQALMFPRPVRVGVSDKNPGAMEAIEDVQGSFPDVIAFSLSFLSLAPPGLRRRSSMRFGDATFMSRRSGCTRTSGVELTSAPSPTHLLLYLNQNTFRGEHADQFAEGVRVARAAGLTIAMIHELDPQRGGCPFDSIIRSCEQLDEFPMPERPPLDIRVCSSQLPMISSTAAFIASWRSLSLRAIAIESWLICFLPNKLVQRERLLLSSWLLSPTSSAVHSPP